MRLRTLFAWGGVLVVLSLIPLYGQDQSSGSTKGREVIEASIEAMGGSAYRDAKNATSQGRYFMFSKGRKGFTRYWDWTVFKDPVKSRFQLDKGKRQTAYVHNLEIDKGWILEGENSVEPLPEEEMKNFMRSVKKDLDYILRNRLDEDGLSLFYYGPDDISGDGTTEAVELIDLTNDSVVIFFNVETHLPVKIETTFIDSAGVRHKRETEFYNWHEIDGILAPLRFDSYVDGELSEQRFLEELDFNVDIPEENFLEPQVKEKKKKKK